MQIGSKQSTKKHIWNSGDFQEEDELTPIGQREHFNLGQNLRNFYINEQKFFPSSFNDFDLHVRSTDANRTLQSVGAQLYGLFPLGTGPNLPEGINLNLTNPPFKNFSQIDPKFLSSNSALPFNFQPICVHTVLEEQDFLLQSFRTEVCPGGKAVEKQNENTSFYQQIESAVLPTCIAVGKKINFTHHKVKKFKDCTEFMDAFTQAAYANWALPDLNETEWKILKFTQNIELYLQLFYDQYSISFYGTHLFQYIIDIFNNKVTGQTKKKWEILSAHHEDVGLMLAALNLTSHQCIYELFAYNKTSALNCIYEEPPFASNLILELYSNDTSNNSYYVKARYNGDYYYLCEKQQYSCDYNEFVTRLATYLFKGNWTEVCQPNFKINQAKIQQKTFHNFYDYLDSLGDNKIKTKEIIQNQKQIKEKEEIQPNIIENLQNSLIFDQNQMQNDNKEQENNQENNIINFIIIGQLMTVIVLAGYYFAQKRN